MRRKSDAHEGWKVFINIAGELELWKYSKANKLWMVFPTMDTGYWWRAAPSKSYRIRAGTLL